MQANKNPKRKLDQKSFLCPDLFRDMDYYWLTTAVAILISVIGIVLFILGTLKYDTGFKAGRHRHGPRLRTDRFDLSVILTSIATGLFVKIIADLFYEVINNNFPEYSNITKIVLACVLLAIIVLAYSLRRSAKSHYRKVKRAQRAT